MLDEKLGHLVNLVDTPEGMILFSLYETLSECASLLNLGQVTYWVMLDAKQGRQVKF